MAFVEDEAIDREGRRGEGAVALQKCLGEADAAPVPAGQGEVLVEGAALRLDFRRRRKARSTLAARAATALSGGPRPTKRLRAPLEDANAGDGQFEAREANPAEGKGDVVAPMAVQPRHEAQAVQCS